MRSPFEWDENKNHANLLKHETDFEEASAVFADPRAQTLESQGSHEEQRSLIVGSTGKRIVTVVFTPREERIRIISARHAHRSEKKQHG